MRLLERGADFRELCGKAGAEAAARHSIELASKTTGPEKDEYLRLNEALIASLK